MPELKFYPIANRQDKVSLKDFGKPGEAFPDNLPNILAGRDVVALVNAIQKAISDHQDILIMMAGHVVKCGCSPFIIELMRRGYISHVAMNGGAMIHDYELARFGSTSESVEDNLPRGKFGMWKESYEILKFPGDDPALPLGYSVGKTILEYDAPNALSSILAEAVNMTVIATVHTAIGADFIHDPEMNLGPLTRGLISDLAIFDGTIQNLSDHAVVLNFGSAVILPEVWLKCVSRAVNMGKDFSGITCANFDMIPKYRQIEQIIKRPRLLGAAAYSFIGHHELLIPMLVKAVLR